MNSSLSFRKESIQRSSNASESLNQTMEARGMRLGGEPGRISITATYTATMR